MGSLPLLFPADGQTEVANRMLEQYLRLFTHSHPAKWSFYLSWAEFCYNNSFHTTIEMSPHEALYGFLARTIPGYVYRSSSVQEVDDLLRVQESLYMELKFRLQQA
ncbi:hypothetical protein AAHE18_06G019300 [Arachis hypogaea]